MIDPTLEERIAALETAYVRHQELIDQLAGLIHHFGLLVEKVSIRARRSAEDFAEVKGELEGIQQMLEQILAPRPAKAEPKEPIN